MCLCDRLIYLTNWGRKDTSFWLAWIPDCLKNVYFNKMFYSSVSNCSVLLAGKQFFYYSICKRSIWEAELDGGSLYPLFSNTTQGSKLL